MQFFLGGGFPMVFIALFGAITIAHAVRFAVWPAPGRARAVVAYAAAVGFAAVAGVCVDLSVTARRAATDGGEDMAAWVLMGASESLAPAILGFAILSVVALAVAVGLRRSP